MGGNMGAVEDRGVAYYGKFSADELLAVAVGEFSSLSPLIKMQAGKVMSPLIAAVSVLSLEVEKLKAEVLKNGK